MSKRLVFAVATSLLLSACGTRGLEALVLEGPDLHESLVTLDLGDLPLHVPHAVLHSNPQLSIVPDFVDAVSRSSSQGQLDSEGIRAALYAVYRGETEVGLYGLEAMSATEADRREQLIRNIWVKNVSLDRARIHRGGNTIIVVWCARLTPSCWEAVNAVIAERLVVR